MRLIWDSMLQKYEKSKRSFGTYRISHEAVSSSPFYVIYYFTASVFLELLRDCFSLVWKEMTKMILFYLIYNVLHETSSSLSLSLSLFLSLYK